MITSIGYLDILETLISRLILKGKQDGVDRFAWIIPEYVR